LLCISNIFIFFIFCIRKIFGVFKLFKPLCDELHSLVRMIYSDLCIVTSECGYSLAIEFCI